MLPSSRIVAGYSAAFLTGTSLYSSFTQPCSPLRILSLGANATTAALLAMIASGTTFSPSAEHRPRTKLAGCIAAVASTTYATTLDALSFSQQPSQSISTNHVLLTLDVVLIITAILPYVFLTILERIRAPSYKSNNPYRFLGQADLESRRLLLDSDEDLRALSPDIHPHSWDDHVTPDVEPGAQYVSSADHDARAKLSGMTQKPQAFGPLVIHVSVEVQQHDR